MLWLRKLKDEKIKHKSNIRSNTVWPRHLKKFSAAEGEEEFGPRGADAVGTCFTVGCMDFGGIVGK